MDKQQQDAIAAMVSAFGVTREAHAAVVNERNALIAERDTMAAQAANQPPPAGVKTFKDTNIRVFTLDGFRLPTARYAVDEKDGGENWALHQWENRLKGRIENAPEHFKVVDPAIARKVAWRDWCADRGRGWTINTTHEQRRDLNSGLYDLNVFENFRKSLDVAKDKGFVIPLTITDVASGQGNSPPVGLLTDDLAWAKTKGQWRLRYDLPGLIDHLIDFMAVVLGEFQHHDAFGGLVLGEYFIGKPRTYPKGFDVKAFRQNRGPELWKALDKVRTERADGTRCAIYQTHPQLESDVVFDDLKGNGIFLSESDVSIHDDNKYVEAIKAAYGHVHIIMNGDSRMARKETMWEIPEDVRGEAPYQPHLQGSETPTLPELLYYTHAEKSDVPVNGIILKVEEGTVQNEENIRRAHLLNGHGGTNAGLRGAAPVV